MCVSKIFLLDFFNNKKIIKIIFTLVLLPLILSQAFSNLNFSSRYAGIIGVTTALASTLYTLSSYATTDKLKLYISLPISSKKLIWGLICIIYLDILFDKLAIFIIVVFLIFIDPLSVVLPTIFTSFICVVNVVALLLTMNKKNKILMWANLFSILGVILSSIILSGNLPFWVAVNIIMLAIPIITTMVYDSAYLMINRQAKSQSTLGLMSRNYFILTMLMEKIYLINTFAIIALIIGFILMSPDEPLILNLAWCLGSINTPAMTMLSGDKWISKQVDMLPNTKKSVINMYLNFLIFYFMLINLLICLVISIKEGSFSWINVLIIVVVTILEVSITIIFEQKWRITDWQIKNELWHHPRKYITPIVIFIIISGISIIMQ